MSPHITRGLGLAALTGLALSDFTKLQWGQIGENAITGKRSKTGGEFVIPLYPALRKHLGERQLGPVLLNSHGRPWTVEGFKTAWQRAKPAGFDRRLHDLRGTCATRLIIEGFTDSEVAMFLGWKVDEVAQIKARYVDRNRVVREMARRLTT